MEDDNKVPDEFSQIVPAGAKFLGAETLEDGSQKVSFLHRGELTVVVYPRPIP